MGKQWFVFTSLENSQETKTASPYLDYLTWNTKGRWTAEYKNGKFYHYENGAKDKCHTDSILNYISDAGENWQMKIEGDHFVHAPNGDYSRAHTDTVMHYIGWDGRKWRAELLTLIDGLHPDLNGDEPLVYPEGILLKADAAAEVYLVQLGSRHHIPNSDVYFALFPAWDKITVKSQEEVNAIPLGIPLSLDACLIKADDSDPVYLSTNGVKSHIQSVEDFNKVGFDWNKIKVMSPAKVDAIPTAPEYGIANW